MKNICPICGNDNLIRPPYDEEGFGSWEICGCCGFEFGSEAEYPNDFVFFEKHRKDWIDSGAKWKYVEDCPQQWNINKQLLNLRIYKKQYENDFYDD